MTQRRSAMFDRSLAEKHGRSLAHTRAVQQLELRAHEAEELARGATEQNGALVDEIRAVHAALALGSDTEWRSAADVHAALARVCSLCSNTQSSLLAMLVLGLWWHSHDAV